MEMEGDTPTTSKAAAAAKRNTEAAPNDNIGEQASNAAAKRSQPSANGNKKSNKHQKTDQPSPVRIEMMPTKNQQKGQTPLTNYYCKQLSPWDFLRTIPPTCNPRNFLRENPIQFTVRDFGHGLWTAFQVDMFGTNKEPPNIQRLYHILGYDEHTSSRRTKKDRDLAASLNVLCACQRRASKDNGESILKTPTGAANRKMKPESMFFLNWTSRSREKKRELLKKLVQIFVESGINAAFPTNFDLSDKTKPSLDNYITDDSIVHLVQLHFQQKTGTFYSSFPEARDAVFVPPYPEIACKMLGYPRVKIEQPDDNQRQPQELETFPAEQGGTENDPIQFPSDTDSEHETETETKRSVGVNNEIVVETVTEEV